MYHRGYSDDNGNPCCPRKWRKSAQTHVTNAPKDRGTMWYDEKSGEKYTRDISKLPAPPDGWSPRGEVYGPLAIW